MNSDRDLRTLIVATQVRLPGQHGGTTHVGELAQHLGDYGETLVLAQRGSSAAGVEGIAYPWRLPKPAMRGLARWYLPRALAAARRFKPDVIYERGSSYGLGAHLSRVLGVPMICMVLDEHFSEVSLRQAGKVIATTQDVVPESARSKWVKVSWGANAQLFSPKIPPIEHQRLPAFDGATIGYAGSFKRWHDLELLVRVADRLRDRRLRFLLVGDGPERPTIEALVKDQGLAERFVFAGSVPYREVPRWLVCADICVAPFRPEGHPASLGNFSLDPLKMFEYLALRKPSITINAHNIAALLSHEQHALLVPPGDVAAWSAALVRLLDDPEWAQSLARRGRDKVLEQHTWAAHAAHLKRIFDGLLAERVSGVARQQAAG